MTLDHDKRFAFGTGPVSREEHQGRRETAGTMRGSTVFSPSIRLDTVKNPSQHVY